MHGPTRGLHRLVDAAAAISAADASASIVAARTGSYGSTRRASSMSSVTGSMTGTRNIRAEARSSCISARTSGSVVSSSASARMSAAFRASPPSQNALAAAIVRRIRSVSAGLSRAALASAFAAATKPRRACAAVADALEKPRHGLIGPGGRSGEVPGDLVELIRVERAGERLVRGASGCGIGVVVRGRAHQWVAELDPARTGCDEPGLLGGMNGAHRKAHRHERPCDLIGIAGVARRCNEQRAPGVVGQRVEPLHEGSLDTATHGDRLDDG